MESKSINDKDIWTPLAKYPGYEINRAGQIREAKTESILDVEFYGDGTNYVSITDDDGNSRKLIVDIMVATTFLPKKYVN